MATHAGPTAVSAPAGHARSLERTRAWPGQLEPATQRLLTADLNVASGRAAIQQALLDLHRLFSEATAVRGDVLEPRHDQETALEGGVAISPHLAARCLLDPLRTVQFLRGVHGAIQAAQRRFPGKRIHLLYAGCGPYATLVLPLLPRFDPDQLQVTLLDVHAPSIKGVRRLVETLDLGAYVSACRQADAITYRHPDNSPLHVAVCETMQAGLAREPQVAIAANLLPQLAQGGLFVPQEIRIEACLGDSSREDIGRLMHRGLDGVPVGYGAERPERLHLGRVMALNRENARTLGRRDAPVPLATIEVPERVERLDQFLLQTTISVHGPFALGPYACELSFPLRLHEYTGVQSGARIAFSYVSGANPGLNHRRLPAEAHNDRTD
jgi:hypothetical protein